MNNVKIITINTWKCDGDYDTRMQVLAKQLKDLNPQIVACQECFSGKAGEADTLKFLAEQLGMNYSFLPGRFKKREFEGKWIDSFSGLGVLSVYPLKYIAQYNLPDVPGDDDRKMQLLEAAIPGDQPLLIANIHLTHIRNTDLRKAQAEFAAERIAAYDSHRYKIICGDFNAMPDSVEIKALMNCANAIDCYTAGNGVEPRYSLLEAFEFGKLICVDHIFAFPFPGANTYPEFAGSSMVLNKKDPETGVYPSDHSGICTTLIIN